jgi:hypothetical protein
VRSKNLDKYDGAASYVITENLALHGEDGEEGWKSFFASTGLEILEDVPLCRMQA